ncbi:MAG TPA: AbrB/MazE/SpoVT family DNA-binding domain-containing protein [Chloroflexota bacterium]|nr:AbrB/MazE/SpoVT family DNA-binding domain-containing protein [Chloroflexota bacterium]
MHVEAKITSKGQVTIPRAIREALHVATGDTVVFEVVEEGVHLRPRHEKTVQAFAGAGRVGSGKTVAEIVAETRVLRDQ